MKKDGNEEPRREPFFSLRRDSEGEYLVPNMNKPLGSSQKDMGRCEDTSRKYEAGQ